MASMILLPWPFAARRYLVTALFCCLFRFTDAYALKQSLITSSEEAQSSSTSSESKAQQMPRGFTACQNFMRNRKAQLVAGPDLVQVVGTMCKPAITAGAAGYRYQRGCQEMEKITAEKYAENENWDPSALCMDVMTIFNSYAPTK
ncbi:unnamed protein product [Amoebophrya sp. A25]|nr:unnamed protein product [Amoebophrya sp. A25]|eukprot:GSA25T00019066001.1